MQDAESLKSRYDVLVVGCGAMGSSVSKNVSSRGLRVLTFDRFGLNHELGSSHGRTRIIRLAYYEDERYVPLLRRAFVLWTELERQSGRKLLLKTGGLMIGKQEGELVQGVLRSAKAHAIPHKLLSASEAESRFEAFHLDESLSAVHEESAGVLFPEECIQAFVGIAKESGCEFKFNEAVTAWKSGPNGVEVQTEKGTYSADKIVFCTGAWTETLLKGMLPLKVERQVVFWFSSSGQSSFSPERMPVFIFEEVGGKFYYGLPDVGHGVKVARTHGGDTVDPDRVNRTVTELDVSPVRDFVSRRLPKLAKEPIASKTCLYTNTPDLNFAVGLDAADPRLAVVSACSGHGFKFAGVMGEVVADLVTDGKSRLDMSFLSPSRFAGR
jgi:sarcosine oxidase